MKGTPLTKVPDHGARVGIMDEDQNITRWSTVESIEEDGETVLLRNGMQAPFWKLCML